MQSVCNTLKSYLKIFYSMILGKNPNYILNLYKYKKIITKKDVSHKTFYIFVIIWKVFARIDIELAAISMKSIEK